MADEAFDQGTSDSQASPVEPVAAEDTVRRLWTGGMKLVVVTYCRSPEEQARVYDRIREICV